MFSEIAFPPFVYLLTIKSPPIDYNFQDITFFSDCEFAQYRKDSFAFGCAGSRFAFSRRFSDKRGD